MMRLANDYAFTVKIELMSATGGPSCHLAATSMLPVRRVLDSRATTRQAIDLLRRLPHAMKYYYSLLDAALLRTFATMLHTGCGEIAGQVTLYHGQHLHKSTRVYFY